MYFVRVKLSDYVKKTWSQLQNCLAVFEKWKTATANVIITEIKELANDEK